MDDEDLRFYGLFYEELKLQAAKFSDKIPDGVKSETIQLGGKSILIRHADWLPKGEYLFDGVVKVNPGALDYIFTFGSAPDSA